MQQNILINVNRTKYTGLKLLLLFLCVQMLQRHFHEKCCQSSAQKNYIQFPE